MLFRSTAVVVNPARRNLENEIRCENNLLLRQRAAWAATNFPAEPCARKAAIFEQKQGQLLESITQRQEHLDQLKAQRAQTPRHIPMKDLPPDQQFTRLRSESKHFIDTLKMIAYRAETALLVCCNSAGFTMVDLF